MRKFTIGYFIIFTISTILTLVIVYKDLNHPLATKIVIGYAIFLVVSALFFFIATLWKGRKLPRAELKKRGIRFLIYFAAFFGISILFNLSDPDYAKSFSIAFGVSFDLSFIDIAFTSNKKENNSTI